MKKIILTIGLGVFICIGVSNINLANNNNDAISMLTLMNIEALAQSENSGLTLDCWNTVTNDRDLNNPTLSTHVTYCGSCKPILATSYSSKSTCK